MSTRLATLALATALVSSPAFASGEFEYTLSEPTTVTTYGTTNDTMATGTMTYGTTTDTMTYGTTTDTTSYGTTTYGTTTYQDGGTAMQGQSDVYQTQPTTTINTVNETGGTFGELVYDSQPYLPNGATDSYTTQSYSGTVGTVETMTYQPVMEQETDASWK